MAAIKEPVKVFIVQSLACFDTPQQVADAVKQRFGIEIERQQCENYDPTKYAGRNLSKKLKDLFERTRKDFGGVSKSMLKQSRLNFDKIEKCE